MANKINKKLTKQELLEMLLEHEDKEIKKMDEMVDLLISKNISINVNERLEQLTLSDRLSDLLAYFAGSWGFIILFVISLILWVIYYKYILKFPVDSYPFLLLNLILSCLAAIQAPIIMMSQNRQKKKDRIRSENDYKIDLKSEIILENMYHKLVKIMDDQDKIAAKLNYLKKELDKKNHEK